jgi:hypothetical protein
LANSIKATVIHNKVLILKQSLSIGSPCVHSNGFDLPFLHSVMRFLSRAVDKLLPFSGPNFVGYFVEQNNVAFLSLGPIYLTMTYLFS